MSTAILLLLIVGLIIRITYFMVYQSEYYSKKAVELHQRERSIKAKRGRILDRNGVVLADNITVCTVSVIHSQIKDPKTVIRVLSEELQLSTEFIKKRVEKVSSIEKIKSNISKQVGDRIREYELEGVKVDEDYKRYYPYGELASKVLGFTGGDNQGIIGLEVKYDEQLQGEPGVILTFTDAKGVEIKNKEEERKEPVAGNDLVTTLDYNIQSYATQIAKQVMETKQATRVSILVMDPGSGEILTMVDVPEFDLNSPFQVPDSLVFTNEEEKQKLLNGIWRNGCINDTYEPGSIFKIITAAAALEEGIVSPSHRFFCPGYIMVEDRRIRCHKYGGHGSVDFTEGIQGSCNPVFISLGLQLGIDKYYEYFQKFKLTEKTGIDLPGEAGTIMHKKENMGPVELATVAFGQSFQITPIQMAATAAALINGGNKVTPHLALKSLQQEGQDAKNYAFAVTKQLVSEETSATLRQLLEKVVDGGTGSNGYVEGYRIGGKTATSQTLPRNSGNYIASFLGFWPAENPKILALAIVHNPKGVYYGGQVAAPIVRQLFENILPYLEGM
ncbi:MAG: peptidoglycan glycosyltransferase [Lachnospiraceae bacterium]|nr:peptidoglycan glycosyltransferase [Lachnospiraceae bacterium]